MFEKKINPWPAITIVLAVVLAAIISYDYSETFRRNVDYFLGITQINESANVDLIVINDKYYPTPPYDLEENVANIQQEIPANYNVQIVHFEDELAQNFIKEFNIKTVPVLIFSDGIEKTSFFDEGSSLFVKKDDYYLLRLTPFRYFELPTDVNGRTKGTPGAPITIVEYGSFTCSHCADMKNIVNQALNEFPGQLYFVYKNFNRNEDDIILSNAAECSGVQLKYWEMHDKIYDNQSQLKSEELREQLNGFATEIGLDVAAFNTCIDEQHQNDLIQSNNDEAYSFGINGTPAIFINDVFIDGAVTYDGFKTIIESFNL